MPKGFAPAALPPRPTARPWTEGRPQGAPWGEWTYRERNVNAAARRTTPIDVSEQRDCHGVRL